MLPYYTPLQPHTTSYKLTNLTVVRNASVYRMSAGSPVAKSLDQIANQLLKTQELKHRQRSEASQVLNPAAQSPALLPVSCLLLSMTLRIIN